jgi:REP element-mobilizing transposase RayT
LPSHFHLVVKLKSTEEVIKYVSLIQKELRLKSETVFLEAPEKYFDELIEAQFHRFFTSYSMSFNRMYGRRGNLFQRAFKRVLIKDDIQMLQAIVYVHANAVKHQITKSLQESRFSSYQSYLSNAPTLLSRNYILDLFGGVTAFQKFHQEQTGYYYNSTTLTDG